MRRLRASHQIEKHPVLCQVSNERLAFAEGAGLARGRRCAGFAPGCFADVQVIRGRRRVARGDGQRACIGPMQGRFVRSRQGQAQRQIDSLRDDHLHQLPGERQRRRGQHRPDRIGDRIAVFQAFNVEEVLELFPDAYRLRRCVPPVVVLKGMAPTPQPREQSQTHSAPLGRPRGRVGRPANNRRLLSAAAVLSAGAPVTEMRHPCAQRQVTRAPRAG